jgi:hypothetical protein
MNDKKSDSRAFTDLERPHPVVADSIGNEPVAEPLAVRLGDLWSDFIRVADEARDPDAPRKASSVVPLLDDMKGILQWD